jgi:hypothetical protein
MKMPDFFTSPPPAAGWSLDAKMAAVVRRQGKGELRAAAVDIPDKVFDIGPVGLQAVDEDRLRPVLTRLQQEVEGSKRAAVLVPTGWLRVHLLEFEELPRRQADVKEVVLWRLKKLLPVAPTSLRLNTVTQPRRDGRHRLLVMAGVERALASLESVFSSVGVSVGILTPRIFAVPDGGSAGSRFLAIQQESGFLSIMLLLDDTPHVVRTKPLPSNDWAIVERELSLVLGFVVSSLGVNGDLEVGISVESEELGRRLKTWVEAADALSLANTASPSAAFHGTGIRDRAGAFRLDPVVNVMSGGVR